MKIARDLNLLNEAKIARHVTESAELSMCAELVEQHRIKHHEIKRSMLNES